jgi:hypothetical protein
LETTYKFNKNIDLNSGLDSRYCLRLCLSNRITSVMKNIKLCHKNSKDKEKNIVGMTVVTKK